LLPDEAKAPVWSLLLIRWLKPDGNNLQPADQVYICSPIRFAEKLVNLQPEAKKQ